MIRLPHDLRAALLANGLEPDTDHSPVLQLVNPAGAGAGRGPEPAPAGGALFGLAGLGFGCPELGAFSLSELGSIRLPFGMGIERDMLFEGRFPLSGYAEAARRQ